MNSIIAKQLLINNLPIPSELQDYIKGHLFVDKITYLARKNKNYLIDCLRFNFWYYESNGHVSKSYLYERQFQCKFCLNCGGYELVSDFVLYSNMPRSALCSCEGFMQYYTDNINVIRNEMPLQIYN